MWLLVWGGLLLVILLLEFYTLASTKKGDTFSEQWWRMVTITRATRVLGAPLLLWLTYHWIFEPDSLRLTHWWDDWLVIAIGVLAGWWRNEVKRRQPPFPPQVQRHYVGYAAPRTTIYPEHPFEEE